MQNKLITLENIDAFIFDFDGVLTNDLVFVDQNGKESVKFAIVAHLFQNS